MFEARTVDVGGFTLSLREAEPEDARGILAFTDAVSAESDHLTFGPGEFKVSEREEADFLQSCREADLQLYLIAEVGSDVVASLHFAAGRRPRVQHSGEFGMAVRQAYWGMGIGSLLIDSLLVWARRTGVVKKIDLRVREDNERAIRLYRKKGFRQEGRLSNEMLVDGRFYDLYAMGLNL